MQATRFRRLRLVVVGCGLFGLLVTHVSVRYLVSTLFGFVTYSGLAPVVPFLVLGLYSVPVGALAVLVAARRGRAGAVLGTGYLLLVVEPLTSSLLWGDGCEVGSTAGVSLLPRTTMDGVAVVVYAWNGACSASLNTLAIGIGLSSVGIGLWMGDLPEEALTRWLMLVETYWPSSTG
jgi:hypothetical protein